MNTEVSSKQRVLVADDEEYIRDLVSTALSFSGYEVTTAADGVNALNQIQKTLPDLIVLDVNMPGFNGFEVLRRLREGGDSTPVVFLTARDSQEDKLSGFTKGGDDYLTKPFSLEELVARVQAVLRRVATTDKGGNPPRLTYADLVIDEQAFRVTRGDRVVDLTPTEFNLLRYLLLNAERVLTKDQILSHVWHYDFDGGANVVETYISYLRRKVDIVEPKLIQTVRGFGYVMRTDG